MQTDTVTNIPCGTSGGVTIYFDNIEVVNILEKDHAWQTIKEYGPKYDKFWIFDKIHHQINQFCSKHTLHEVYIDLFETLDEALAQSLQTDCDAYKTGIKIISIRVTKPRIPESIRNNFELVETNKAHFLVVQQEQLVLQKKEETTRMQERIRAERDAEIARINAQKEAVIAQIAAEKAANVSLIQGMQKTAEEEAQAKRVAQVSNITQTMLNAEKNAEASRARIDIELEAERQKKQIETQKLQEAAIAEVFQSRLTPEFLKYTLITAFTQSLANNTKFYFGEKIPQMFVNFATAATGNMESLQGLGAILDDFQRERAGKGPQ